MRRRIPKWLFVVAPLGFAAFIALGGWVVMLLWNWLGPELFALREVTFWQALGLLMLCRILFGGFGMGGGRHRSRRRGRDGWEELTPEERERFRQGLYDRSGRTTPLDPLGH